MKTSRLIFPIILGLTLIILILSIPKNITAGSPGSASANRASNSYSDLDQARNEGMTWVTETVDSAVGAGTWNSLALDDDGLPHISYVTYRSDSGYSLMYAYFDSTEWITETVDNRSKARRTSLALDGDGYPHISYHDGDNDDLRYAYLDASGWHTRTLKSTGDVGD